MANGDQALIQLRVYDGTRQPIDSKRKVLVRVRDGSNQKWLFEDELPATTEFPVAFFDNYRDDYTVMVSSDKCVDAGFAPVKVDPARPAVVELMLLPDDGIFQFSDWSDVQKTHPIIASFLAIGSSAADARSRYNDLSQNKRPVLASLVNLITAMSAIHLPSGTPLDYFRQIDWDDSMKQDRFFGFATRELVDQVKRAAEQGGFASEVGCAMFHKDATCSYKQIQFGEANVQLTFHENTLETIGGEECVRVEPDIDYFKDLGAHALFEVVPNLIQHGLTDPRYVYALRWIAGKHAGVPEFDPPYVIVPPPPLPTKKAKKR